MIVSVSRRTDIPALYADWFFNRLAAGSALVRNPFNASQLRQVSLLPTDVGGLVFWTRNPAPMLSRLARLEAYRYYFMVTITGYGAPLEAAAPETSQVVQACRELSRLIGPQRVIWRYDPIILDAFHDTAWHTANFARLATELHGATAKCILSFLSLYAKTRRNLGALTPEPPELAQKLTLAAELKHLAAEHGMELCACCEPDLSALLAPAACVNADLLGLSAPRDRHQRPGCSCAQSVDIGAYDSCIHGCRYCYANASPHTALRRAGAHDPASPLLIGRPQADDSIIKPATTDRLF